MESSFFTVFPVPTPASPEHVSSYKTIRLKGLSTDPKAFGSTFAREAAFPPETWHARLNTPGRTTLGAAKHGDETRGEWIGTLSILSPEMLAVDPRNRLEYPPKLRDVEERGVAEVYMLVGMWVHSDHRRLAVGTALIDYALQTVKSSKSSAVSAAKADIDYPTKFKNKVVLLQVHKENLAAQGFYEKAGFIVEEGDELLGDDEIWMVNVLS